MPSLSLEDLNPEQRAAVLAPDGPILILAGAGSGKTRVLTQRIAHQLAEGMAAPERMLAVTFTNKSAKEMRDRVAVALGEDSRFPWVSTFHSACAQNSAAGSGRARLRSQFYHHRRVRRSRDYPAGAGRGATRRITAARSWFARRSIRPRTKRSIPSNSPIAPRNRATA